MGKRGGKRSVLLHVNMRNTVILLKICTPKQGHKIWQGGYMLKTKVCLVSSLQKVIQRNGKTKKVLSVQWRLVRAQLF